MKPTGSQRTRYGAVTLLAALALMGALPGGLPTPGVAQTVKPADLRGAWARQGETEIRFTFASDSSVTFPIETNAGPGIAAGRWRLVGDTLLIDRVRGHVTINNMPIPVQGSFPIDPRLVALKDSVLTLTRLGGTNEPTGPLARIYVRAAAAPPPQVVAQTATPTDLLGAWTHQGETKVIFTFLADSTVTFPVPVQYGQQSIEGTAQGRWRLVGDTLRITQVKSTARGQVVPGSFSVDPRLVMRKDSLLTLTQLAFTLPNGAPDTSAAARASAVRVYQRVEPNPPPTQPAAKP